MEKQPAGLIHLYCGDGKGKTTAATGLAVRMAGAGKQVVFAQFYKDGSSCEIKAMAALGVLPMHCKTVPGRFSQMDPSDRDQARKDYSRFLLTVFQAAEQADLLVLDEVISASNHGTVEEERLIQLLCEKPAGLEVVLTGRDPSRRLLALADYVTQMEKIKHPFDRGIGARRGVEF